MQLKKNKTKRTSSNGSEASLTGIPVLLLTACTIFKMLSLTVLGLIPLIYNILERTLLINLFILQTIVQK